MPEAIWRGWKGNLSLGDHEKIVSCRKMISIVNSIKKILSIFIRKDPDLISHRIRFNISWALIGSVVSRSFVMIATIIFGRILGSEQFGELGIIQNTIVVFVVVASSGISLGVTKYVAELRAKEPQSIFGFIRTGLLIQIGLGLIGVCILFFVSPAISKSLSSTTDISSELILFGFTLLFVSVNNVQIGVLSGFEKFDTIAFIHGVRGVLILALGVLGCYRYGINGALVGLESAEFVTMVISYILLKKFMRSEGIIEPRKSKDESFVKIVKFGVPSMIGSVVTMLAFWFCNYLLIKYNTYEAMGIFNAADKWKQILIFIPTSVSPTILPILSNLSSSKDKYRNVYRTNIYLNMGIILIPALVMIVLAKFAMGLYGEEFIQGYRILILLILASIFSVLNNVIGHSLISLGAINTRTALDIVLSVFVVGCALVLVPSRGGEGLAFAYLVGYFVTSILVFIVTRKMLIKKELI